MVMLFAICIGYGLILFIDHPQVAVLFIVFAILCNIIIVYNNKMEIKNEMAVVLKDLDFLLKRS